MSELVQASVRFALMIAIAVQIGGPVAMAERNPDGEGQATIRSDWPTFLGPSRNGKSAETGLEWNWPEEGPPILWQTALGESYSAPSISDGRLFHFDRHDNEDRLTCRDARTGEEHWSVASPTAYRDMLGYNGGPRCSPVVDGVRVYTISADGRLQCRSIQDGELKWELDTGERFHVAQNFFGVGSTPFGLR